MLAEPMEDMFRRSQILTLDFANIPEGVLKELDMRHYFADCEKRGENPRDPRSRQYFNNAALAKMGARYLVGQYAEDRIAMLRDTPAGQEGRTFHMGVDVFAADLELVRSPCTGTVVRSDYEPGHGEYGNYVILQPDTADYYIFFGHLARRRIALGAVRRGQRIGHLGDYAEAENGGWSRHLHIQILKELPPEGMTPIGYSTQENLKENISRFPNPMEYFTSWRPL